MDRILRRGEGVAMFEYLGQVDALWLAVGYAIIFLVAFHVGFWVARRRAARDSSEKELTGKVADACMALMALLLAFTFATAYSKFESRQDDVTQEANAIGTFFIRTQLLGEPQRGQARELTREYVRLHLVLTSDIPQEERLEVDRQIVQKQSQIQELVFASYEQPEMRWTAVPVLGAMNQMFDEYEARLASAMYRVPTALLLMLFVASTVSAYLLGRAQGAVRERPTTTTYAFFLLLAAIIYLTLDLDNTYRGLTRANEVAMERLAQSIGVEQQVPGH